MTNSSSLIIPYIKLHGHFETHRAIGSIVKHQAGFIPLFYDLWCSARGPIPLRGQEPDISLGTAHYNSDEPIDVLFLPLQTTSNFLGACKVLADALVDFSSQVRIGFLDSIGCPLPPEISEKYLSIPFGLFPTGDDTDEPSSDMTEILKHISAHPEISQIAEPEVLIERHKQHCFMISKVRAFIKQRKIRVILAPNEFLPASAIFLAAAKLEGIPFIQMLHSIPERFYAPFFANEIWVWNEKMRSAFIEYGAQPEQVQIVGNLELAYQRTLPVPAEQDLLVPRKRVLLFFMQDIGKQYNLNDLFIVRDAFALLSDEWSLRIRMKPGHNIKQNYNEVQNLINEIFGGFDGRVISTINRLLWSDLFDADVVCGGTTSATYIAMGLGFPVAFLWNNEINTTRGEAMANPQRVCRNADDLVRLINDPLSIPSVDQSEMAHLYDATHFGASRIMKILMDVGY